MQDETNKVTHDKLYPYKERQRIYATRKMKLNQAYGDVYMT